MSNVYESEEILCILGDKIKDARHKDQDNNCEYLYLNFLAH
jgi:hypothetical protein